MDDATLAQVNSADPRNSTWLSANAGSGKTRVLTDRVARLLLNETPPERILCLTYTKAAASEMQNRLFRRLGDWAMLDDAALSATLAELGEPARDPEVLRRARRLFARAIEAPGGLKIQTIHAFCASLLRRFPLEAGVAPDFTEADERSLAQLRAEVLDQLSQGPESGLLRPMMARLSPGDLDTLILDIGKHRDAFEKDNIDLHALFGLPRGFSAGQLARIVFQGGEAELLRQASAFLARGAKTDVSLGEAFSALSEPDLADLPLLENKLLFGKNTKAPFCAKKIGTVDTRKAMGDALCDEIDSLAERVAEARPLRLALETLDDAQALHAMARAWLPAYDRAKAARRWLDFDDLIRLARALLENPVVAEWVMFKLDGGIDHILIDEAQDTSPLQWKVIEHLTQEFTAGQGARDTQRTIFVVGDRKQSIYSFQGADLTGFETMRQAFTRRLAESGQALNAMELLYSFRSSEAVLRLVDACFDTNLGASGLFQPPRHLAFHAAKPGRVDLWPGVEQGTKPDDPLWFDPVDRPSPEDASQVLAREVASRIRALIDEGVQIETAKGPRPVHEGDFLILVRKRRVLFRSLIRACKEQGLAIAGADRLELARELAVQDLMALLRFLALPEDDLSLAIALRSPLFAWTEDRLFRLSQGRGPRSLWEVLRADPTAEHENAVLRDLLGQVDFLRPYELLERILTRHGGRIRLLTRLGEEMSDPIEAFVELALSYEEGRVPSLDGFLAWLEASDAEVKRQSEAAGQRVRVMTVHGAKGLEAPIVILPDTALPKNTERARIALVDGQAILRANKDSAHPVQLDADMNAQRAREQEADRLLYVALTRAQSWLIVAGAGDELGEGSWYARVEAAMTSLPCMPLDTTVGPGRRYEHGEWPPPLGNRPQAGTGGDAVEVPALAPLAPRAPRMRPLSPSALGGAKVLPGVTEEDPDALARGTLVHTFLETLPRHDRALWPGLMRDIATGQGADRLRPETVEEAGREAFRVLDHAGTGWIFGADSLAEVSVSGLWQGRAMMGQIDRLIVTPDRVLVVDFKTNRHVPRDAAATPEGIVRQLAAYRAMLAPLYPGRVVECAVLWTATATLSILPRALLDAALDRAALDPDLAAS